MPGPQRRGGAPGGSDGGRRGGRDGGRDGRGGAAEKTAYVERVVAINRVAKVVKGGRRFSFTALVVVGDGDGTVGVGYGKAKEVPAAIAKGVEEAKKHFFKVPRIQGTIPHPIQGEKAAGVVLLKPASPGTGVIAGGPVRAVLECAGIHDVLSKSLGSSNPINIVHATVAAPEVAEVPEGTVVETAAGTAQNGNEPREARRGSRERSPRNDRGARGGREDSQFLERVVTINRVSKVVKGGRRFSFTALVVVGDGNGMVGVGYGKAREVPLAISKGVEEAKKNFFRVPRSAKTIPHPVQGEAAAGVVLLRPAAAGTGVIAGGPVRAVLECAGIHDILSKSLGSSNTINIVHATVAALKQLEEPRAVAARRGLEFEDVAPERLIRAEADDRAAATAKAGA